MDVSVSFSNNQIHEGRTREDRENLDVQMEKDPLGLLFTDPHVTHIIPGNWDVGRCVLDNERKWRHRSIG